MMEGFRKVDVSEYTVTDQNEQTDGCAERRWNAVLGEELLVRIDCSRRYRGNDSRSWCYLS